MVTRLQLLSLCMQYEDELLQAISQSVMPLDRLVGSANSAAALSVSMGEQPARQAEDLLAQELLTWFKHDFFTWVKFASDSMYIYHIQCARAPLHICVDLSIYRSLSAPPSVHFWNSQAGAASSLIAAHMQFMHISILCEMLIFNSIPFGSGEQPSLQPLRQ